jgi:hypothetical protein
MPNTGLFKIGDRVKLKTQAGRIGRVAEDRGPLGPKGARVYRVLIRRKPRPGYVEVMESHLEPAEEAPSKG